MSNQPLTTPCNGYGKKIKLLREKQGLTVEQLANLVSSNVQHILDLEVNKLHPSNNFIQSLASILKVDFFSLNESIWCLDRENCNNDTNRI